MNGAVVTGSQTRVVNNFNVSAFFTTSRKVGSRFAVFVWRDVDAGGMFNRFFNGIDVVAIVNDNPVGSNAEIVCPFVNNAAFVV